jgi:serine/threonine-protein kinase
MASMAGPQSLGRYQLERVLGKGAMGIVYEALDPKLHRKVAIKTILISQLDEDTAKDFSMRFVREAHAVARLNHPNIVQVYDFGEEAGIAFLVMEFIRGTELKSSLSGNQLIDRKECVRVMCELLDALDFAHEAGVIHRDIKPANILLDSQGRAKLADFGVARLTDSDKTSVERTQAGTMVGTPAYMSPEQIQGQRIDRRTDIFSAGIILYQFLTGQKPFSGEGAWTVAKKIVQEDPPTPSSLNVSVSPEFDRVVAKALAKSPDARFQTAREFARALKLASEGKSAIQQPDPAATLIVSPQQAQASGSYGPSAHQSNPTLKSGEMELEFWRSIKDSNDANDYDAYVRQFPQGVYATLALRKIAKLRGQVPGGAEDSGLRTMDGTDRTRLLRPEAAVVQRTAGERTGTVKLGEASSEAPTGKKSSLLVPGVLGVLVVAGAAAYFVMGRSPQAPVATTPKVQTDETAKREAAEKAKTAEAQARQEAEARAKQEAEARAKQEAAARAKQEAEAQAKREAEAKTKSVSKAQGKRDAELKAQREAEAKAQREAEARAQREAQARAQREAEAKAQREAEAKAQREAEARAKREAEAKAQQPKTKAQRDAEAKAQREAEAKAKREAEAREKARLEQERREKQAAERAKQEAERKKDSGKAKSIVVPTF